MRDRKQRTKRENPNLNFVCFVYPFSIRSNTSRLPGFLLNDTVFGILSIKANFQSVEFTMQAGFFYVE